MPPCSNSLDSFDFAMHHHARPTMSYILPVSCAIAILCKQFYVHTAITKHFCFITQTHTSTLVQLSFIKNIVILVCYNRILYNPGVCTLCSEYYMNSSVYSYMYSSSPSIIQTSEFFRGHIYMNIIIITRWWISCSLFVAALV